MGLPESAVRAKVLSEPERSLNCRWRKEWCQLGGAGGGLGVELTNLVAHDDGEGVAVVT
jgi:hypothetical protein